MTAGKTNARMSETRPPWPFDRARLTPPAPEPHYSPTARQPDAPRMSRPAHHVFVCQNERPVEGRPSCGARGGGNVFTALQREVGARPELWGRVAVTGCACLGPCFEGPTV